MFNRRTFLSHTLAGVGTLGLAPSWLSATPAQTRASNAYESHQRAAHIARELRGDREVTLKVLLPIGSRANVSPVSEWFEQTTGVRFVLEEVPLDEINSRFTIDAASGRGEVDIALPATFGIPELAGADALLPLDDLETRYAPPDYADSMLYTAGDHFEDHLYGYQTDGDVYLMFYRSDWLGNETEQARYQDHYGEPLALPQTWQQLDRLLEFFHRPDEGRFGGALFRTPIYMVWEYWCRLHAKGVLPFDENMQPQIQTERAVEALAELIAASAHLYPAARANGLFENWKAYAEGNIFCNIGWGGTQKYLMSEKSKVRGRLAHGPTPGGMVNGRFVKAPYFNWGWTYTISSQCREPDLAYLFVLSACSPKLSSRAVAEGGGFFDPFRREHYSDSQIVETYGRDFLTAHQDAMQDSVPDLYVPGHGQYLGALRANLVSADRGELSASEALTLTARQWSRITRQLGGKRQVRHWQRLRETYPPHLLEVAT